MQLAEQLRAAGLACFPCWTRYDAKKQRYDKGPAVPKGESWKATAQRPVDDPAISWASGVVGLPIPANVLVLDEDSYKNENTRAEFERYIGAPLEWDRAKIQETVSGGVHYAFYCPWEARQLQDGTVTGMDTRAAGRGFICSGKGYTPAGVGVFRLAFPQSLPALPAAARAALEVQAPAPAPTPPPVALPQSDDALIEALRHIDPSGGDDSPRANWMRTMLALRHHYRDDPDTGLQVAERWSAGDFWPGGCPDNYEADGPGSTASQWASIKPDGGVTAATLYYKAMRAGWTPPATFDTAAAFGADAAPVNVFEGLVARIHESGGAATGVPGLVDEIRAAGCNALQVSLLAAELKNQLKEAGIKDKAVTAHIDSLLDTRHAADPSVAGAYDKNDTDNAVLFLSQHYPDGSLVRCDGEFYKFTGKVWARLTADTLKAEVYRSMSQYRAQDSRMAACYRTVSNLIPTRDGMLNPADGQRIVFDNGVLDLATGATTPHDPAIFTTNIMPFDWNPGAVCPQWLAFLADVFDGDQERADLLQEWFGYLMTRRYDHQKIMFMLGGPRCGKGTIGRILKALVGPLNFSGGSLSSLAQDSYIDGIRSKPVVFIGDAQKKIASTKVNEVIERLKSISGNDEVSWHRMYYGAMSDTLPCRFTFAANNIPALFDDSGALAGRMLLLTFEKSYLGNEDLTLGDRLESEIEGIAAWALQGLRRLSQNGAFTAPRASELELEDIRNQYSPLSQFLSECCEIREGAACAAADLHNTYRAWGLVEGIEMIGRRPFVSAVKDATRGRGVRYIEKQFNGLATLPGVETADPAGLPAAAFKVVQK